MMKKIAVLAVVVLGTAACVWAQTKPPVRAGGITSFPVDTTVTFDVRTRTIKPTIALIPPGAALDLRVVGLVDGQTLEIDFRAQNGQKGPFAKTESNVRGRYFFKADGTLSTGPEDALRVEAWKFDVILRDRLEADVWAIDPMIVVKE